MLPDNEGQPLKTFLLSSTTSPPSDPTNFAMGTTSDSSTVWTTIPQIPPNDKDATAAEIVAISEAYGTSSTTSLTSSVTSQYQYNSYPTSAQYAMYTSANPASYYQQMASNLRAQTTAFPYALTATPSYYAGSYPVDYTSAAAAYQSPYYTNIRGTAGASYYNPLNTAAAAYASAANSILTSDAVNLGTDSSTATSSVGSFSLKEKKQKAKKKKLGSCSPGDETYARVFIWDLDDITVISRAYLASVMHSQPFPGYSAAASNISHLMEACALTSFSDMTEVLEGDVINIEDAVVDETVMDGGPMDNLRGLDIMRRVAPKYANYRQFYSDVANKCALDGFKQEGNVISFDLLDRVGMLAREAEMSQSAVQLQNLTHYGQRWQCAQRCMNLVVKRSADSAENYANVVLSTDGVIFGSAQLMISGLSGAVPIENVYSVSKSSRESIFEKIQTRYGKKCSFVCVSSNNESATTAKRMGIPVWPLTSNNDLDKLLSAQTNYLLG